MERIYDVVVVGVGPAGWRVAIQLVKNGMSAALVENELVEGECNYWVCVPSKALLRPPEALTEASEVEDRYRPLNRVNTSGAIYYVNSAMVSHKVNNVFTKLIEVLY